MSSEQSERCNLMVKTPQSVRAAEGLCLLALFHRSVEGEFKGVGKKGHACIQLARILQYMECPQYVDVVPSAL